MEKAMLMFTTLTENEKKLLFHFIRFADEYGLTRVDAANIHTNPREFGIRPLTLQATFSKLCEKSVLMRVRDNDTYYYELHPDCVDEIDDFTTNFSPTVGIDDETVPASDRFVSLDDNNPTRKDAQNSLANLSKAIRESNDLFASSDERLQVSREINHIAELIREPAIHVTAVWDSVKRNHTLKWLMEQSASVIVRTAAAKAFEHLEKLIQILFSH